MSFKVWGICMDPETDSLDYEKPIQEWDVEEETNCFYHLPNGRRIRNDSHLYQFFYEKRDAEKAYVHQLINLKGKLQNELRKVNVALRDSPHRYGARKKKLVVVTHPDGKETVCTRNRAIEIVGISPNRMSGVISSKATTRNGFRVAWQE